MYINTFYDHNIIINFLKKKIFKKLTFLKKRILQTQFFSQLNDKVVFIIINVTKKLAYNFEDSIYKIFKTFILSLKYNNLIKSEIIQQNTVAILNNFQCDNKLSTFKLNVYLTYSRNSKFL